MPTAAPGWDFGGKVVRERQMINDIHGRFGELLAKAIDQHALDRRCPRASSRWFRQFLPAYAGSTVRAGTPPDGRSGYAVEPGGYARRRPSCRVR